MHPRIEELLNYLISARCHLDDAVAAVPSAVRELRAAPDRWSVANVLEHLAIVETGIARLISRRVSEARAAGLGPDPETTTILWTLDTHRVLDRRERIVASDRAQPKGLGFDESARSFDAAHAALRDAIAAADGVALDRITHPHPAIGELNLYQWAAFAAAHEMRHALQVREMQTPDPRQ